MWGSAADVVTQIERARAAGVEVFACQYPYTASATGLSAALLDRWIQDGGREQMLARLRDRDLTKPPAACGRRTQWPYPRQR